MSETASPACVVAIHQPPYLPWLGLLDKIARADVFVVLDCVQYNKRAFQHRTIYSTDSGPKYLSLSVASKGTQSNSVAIRDIELADCAKPGEHLETLRHRYGRRPGWSQVADVLAPVLLNPPRRLLELNVALLRTTLEAFGLFPKVVLASELTPEGTKSDLMVSLTKAAGGDVYLTGAGADAYMDQEVFDRAGLGVWRQSFVHPSYKQSHSGAFVPGCFALEWIIEDCGAAVSAFHAQLARTGATPPRCLGRLIDAGI